MSTLPDHLLRATAVVSLALGLVACSSVDPLAGDASSSEAKDAVMVGSQGFAESDILAYVYGLALADAGFDVDYQLGIGARETFLPALQDGSIDFIADYSGNLLRAVDADATATASDDIATALPSALEPLGLSVLIPAPGQNADSLVVTSAFAKEHDLVSIGDLAPLASTLTIGSNTEYETRSYGRPGLAELYGVEGWTFVAIDDFGGPATLDALLTNKIQVADIFSTNPALKSEDLVVLEDPKQMIAAQNIVPLLNSDILTPELEEIVNPVSAALTTDELIALNEAAAGDSKPSPESVAKKWLIAHKFIHS